MKIEFDTTFILPAALREMAKTARRTRDKQDGRSAAQWQAWDNLAASLDHRADLADQASFSQAARVRSIPTGQRECMNCEGRCGNRLHAILDLSDWLTSHGIKHEVLMDATSIDAFAHGGLRLRDGSTVVVREDGRLDVLCGAVKTAGLEDVQRTKVALSVLVVGLHHDAWQQHGRSYP